MGQLQESKIAGSRIAFTTRFNKYFANVEDNIRQFAMDIPSSFPTETYTHLGAVPGFTEWIDDRKLSKRRFEAFSIANKEWSSGIRMSRRDILDDKLGMLGIQVDELAKKAKLHWANRLVDAFIAGFTLNGTFGNAYDGLAFFSASHVDGTGSAQSNLSTAALDKTAYNAARVMMHELTDEEGDDIGVRGSHLLVGPSNELNALEIVKGAVVPGPDTESITNMLQNTAEVVVSSKLKKAYANYWMLADLRGSAKPFIVQINEDVTTAMVPATGNPNDLSLSESLFMRKDMYFGAQAYGEVGFGLWQLAHGSNGTT